MSNPGFIKIRHARIKDCGRVLELMRELAAFEGYLDQFRVTEADLVDRCFNCKDFHILVAETNGNVAGILVYYFLPFTYDLTPWAFLKELYVEEPSRHKGIGRLLMKQAAVECVARGGKRVQWDVLADNGEAQSFYRSLGAVHRHEWYGFVLKEQALNTLAGS